MSDSQPRRAATQPRHRLAHRAGCTVAFVCCLLTFLTWFFWNPFERIQDAEPLASIKMPTEWPPYRAHAADRDELVFLNRNSAIEVYRIDPKLTRLRVVPLTIEGLTELDHSSAFPVSPRAAIFGKQSHLIIVNTETGQMERKVLLPDSTGDVIVSPNERWLALNLHHTQVLARDPETGVPISTEQGWRAARCS